MKKNAGASLGSSSRICRLRLPSIWAMVTRTDNPRPSAKTTLGVGVPGRCSAATASRTAGRRRLPMRRAANTIAPATRRKVAIAAAAPATNHSAKRVSLAVATASAASAINPAAVAKM